MTTKDEALKLALDWITKAYVAICRVDDPQFNNLLNLAPVVIEKLSTSVALAEQDSEPLAQDEALKYLKAVTFGFGPDEPIQLDRETWARIHSAIKQVIAHPEQHSAPAVQPLTSAPDSYVPCCADQTCPKCVAAKSQPLTVPQDFYTHKQSWRRAIECAIEWSKGSDSDADELYFKHELKAFDSAYAELLAAAPEAPAVQPLTDEQKRAGFRQKEEEWTFRGMTPWQVWLKACAWTEAAHGIGATIRNNRTVGTQRDTTNPDIKTIILQHQK